MTGFEIKLSKYVTLAGICVYLNGFETCSFGRKYPQQLHPSLCSQNRTVRPVDWKIRICYNINQSFGLLLRLLLYTVIMKWFE